VPTDRLSPFDATFLELEEADEAAHMHIGAVMVFESRPGTPPSPRRLRKHLEARLGALPRYRCQLSEPHTGGLRRPAWEPDPDFRIEEHVRHAALPAPGGDAELLEWAGDYWSQRLDRQRPLWDAVLLEGLESGRWAVATKTHHALVDGIGSVDVGHLLLDASRRPRRSGATLDAEEQGEPPSLASRLPGAVVSGIRSGLAATRDPGRLRDALLQSKAMVELLLRDELVPAPHSGLNVRIGTRRRYRIVRADLAELKRIKTALGGTVNDVVLAAAAGGLRRMLLERGEPLPERGLRAMVPVNVRTAADHLRLGNRVSSLFVHLPVAEPDARRRYARTVGEAETLKSGDQATGGAGLVALVGIAPPVLHSLLARSVFASRLFNLTITNVPGPQVPLYAFGARLEEVLPLVPLAADHAVGIAVVSYDGKLVFGLAGDGRAAPDLDVLAGGIKASLDDLRELATERRPVRAKEPSAPGA
jgi:diacylglycerol O-acyltransferase / wax synthase